MRIRMLIQTLFLCTFCAGNILAQQSDATTASVNGKTSALLFYQPAPDLFAADNWCFKKEDLWYVYACQPNAIGVAVSRDLTAYEYKAVAIPGSWYGGDTFAWKGKHYMLYSHPGGEGNFINLAESADLLKWTDYPKNPVMSFPDARWYDGATYKDSLRELSACRDVCVIDDASTGEWLYCCFAGDTGRGDHYRRGCIGLARSKNLTDWEYLPPLFAPGLYTLMEVPRVCRIGEKWFLTWLHCPWYGFRTDEDLGRRARGPGETMIHYAVADAPLGPYRIPDEPTLFRGDYTPYVIDLVRDGQEVLLVSTMFKQEGDAPSDRARGGLLPAMPVRAAQGNPENLEVCFPERTRAYFPGTLTLTDGLQINTRETNPPDVRKAGNTFDFTTTSLRVVDLTEPTEAETLVDLEYRVEKGRAGLLIRYDPAGRLGCAILVDPGCRELQFAELAPAYARGMILRVLERHEITAPVSPSFHLSVIASHDYQMVFVNDVLVGSYSFARRNAGALGLILENATGRCAVKAIHSNP